MNFTVDNRITRFVRVIKQSNSEHTRRSGGEIMSPKKEYYDVTPEQREILLWRDAKRKELRELYLKDTGHPTKSLLFDTGLHRYAASKTTVEQFFVPTVWGHITKVGFIAGSIILTALFLKKRRDAREHLYRTGQVSYADRQFKFT